MFVDKLSNREKLGLMQLITFIANADGNITKDEMSFLSNYADEQNIEFDVSIDSNLEEACSLIESERSKVIVIQEIVKMALADGHYDLEERKGALAIANMLSLPLNKFEEIESWVIEGIEWLAKGEKMVA